MIQDDKYICIKTIYYNIPDGVNINIGKILNFENEIIFYEFSEFSDGETSYYLSDNEIKENIILLSKFREEKLNLIING